MNTSTLLTALFLLAAPLPRAYAEDPAPVLARAKQASGGEAWDVKTLYTRAKVSTGGLDGTAESWEDVWTGRFVTTFKLGSVGRRPRAAGRSRCGWTPRQASPTAKDLLLPEVRDRFKTSAPGTNVRLTVKSGDGTRDVTLVLRDLV